MNIRVKQLVPIFIGLILTVSLQCFAKNQSAPEPEDVVANAKAGVTEQMAMVSDLYTKALNEIDAGNTRAAKQLLDEILEKDPGYQYARLQQGRLLIQTGSPEQAMAVLSPLLADSDADGKAWFWMGTASLMSGHLIKASDYLDTALSYNSQVAAVWLQRAVVAQERKNFEGALQLLQTAIELSPDDPLIWLNFAYVNDQKGEKNTAIKAYRQFLKLSANKKGYDEQRKAVVSILLNVN